MKSLVLSFLVLFIFSSCLVVKIYESPVSEETTCSKPNEVHRELIRSGKVIKPGEQGESEILFFGREQSPKNVFFKSDSLFSGQATWIEEEPKEPIFISKMAADNPLFVIDGKIERNTDLIETINPDQIESINVLKGEVALKKYGAEGVSGVIEISTKKE